MSLNTFGVKQARVTEVTVTSNGSLRSLFLCTGILDVDYTSDGHFTTGTVDLRVPLSDGPQPGLDIGARRLFDASVTVALSDFDNLNTDNGQWKVDSAKIVVTSEDPGHPHLVVVVGVNGNDSGDIRLHGVNYVAFLLVEPKPLQRLRDFPLLPLLVSATAGAVGALALNVTSDVLRHLVWTTPGRR